MTLVQWNIFWWSSSGMPIMSQITCNGSGPASSLTASAVPSGCLAIMSVTSRRARARARVSGPRPHLRGERWADGGSPPWALRVVEHDHRAEVFGALRCLVVDGDVRAGAEDLGVTARVEHVGDSARCPRP